MIRCKFCNKTKDDHGDSVHDFVAEGQPGVLPQRPTDARSRDDKGADLQVRQGGDLALRVVLLEKGLITPEELEAAEAKVAKGGLIYVRP